MTEYSLTSPMEKRACAYLTHFKIDSMLSDVVIKVANVHSYLLEKIFYYSLGFILCDFYSKNKMIVLLHSGERSERNNIYQYL